MQQFELPMGVAEADVVPFVPPAKSPKRMGDAELVADLCDVALPVAQHMITAAGSLSAAVGLDRVSKPGNARLAVALELVKRAQAEHFEHGPALTSPADVGEYLTAQLRHVPYEVFACVYLDNMHRVLGFSELFHGTVDGSVVHPREVVRACLQRNAAAIVVGHNHPSGLQEPSHADRAITRTLREALGLVGVRLLDHLIIGNGEAVSMAEKGLI